jgi:large subunit ribosomal protein L29
MKQLQVQELSTIELKDRITEETQALAKMVFNHTVSTLENPLKIRSSRRVIARLKTELRKRELTSTAN